MIWNGLDGQVLVQRVQDKVEGTERMESPGLF